MIKGIVTQNATKILIFLLLSSFFFNLFQYKKNNDLEKKIEKCKKNDAINNSIINDLEGEKEELEEEKEELENKLEE